MSSLETLGKSGRFELSGLNVISLIVIGYLSIAGSVFVAFTNRPEPRQAIEQLKPSSDSIASTGDPQIKPAQLN